MKKILNKIKNVFNRSTENKISYSEMKNIFNNNKNVYIIDVRSSQEYKEGYLQNAINIPEYELKEKIGNFVKDKNSIIILYCQTEIRSLRGKKKLENLGYSNIYILRKGIEGLV